MNDFDDISFDENDFPTDFEIKNDYLEDSILGGLLKESSKQLGQKNTANKQTDLPTSSAKLFSINSKGDTSPPISINNVRNIAHSDESYIDE